MPLKQLLRNYILLRDKVDLFCAQSTRILAEHITCAAGCHGCCRHISLFPVEAVALAAQLRQLPGDTLTALRERARQSQPESPCPALVNGMCAVYEARPLICRTHGLPIATSIEGTRKVDHCPLNFRNLPSLPGSAILELDRLNETLVAVNAVFIGEYNYKLPARLWICEALLLDVA